MSKNELKPDSEPPNSTRAPPGPPKPKPKISSKPGGGPPLVWACFQAEPKRSYLARLSGSLRTS